MLINDNLIDLVITPAAKSGESATVTSRPATAAYQIDARCKRSRPAAGPRSA